MTSIDLTGRKALVTGGARGIGAGIVRVLADCGARVTFTHLGSQKDVQAAKQMLAALASAGHEVWQFTAAAEDLEQMERAVAAAAAWMGGLDLLVPNVGATWSKPIEEMDLAHWRKAIDLNLTTAFVAINCALSWLLQAERADIVLISSSGVVDGGGSSAAYTAGKAGVEGMMAGLMRELPAKGIHINAVRPCVVDTELLRERYDTEDKRAQLAAQVPLGRLARPEDVAHLVAFLSSALGEFICGQAIMVDGGRVLFRRR